MATQVVNLNTQMGASGANHASGVVPDPGTSAGTSKFLREDATFQNAVQSIALTMPAEFVVGGSPVMTSGTFAVTKATEIANTIWAGPTTGAAAQPTFRALVAADIPAPIGFTVNSGTVSTRAAWALSPRTAIYITKCKVLTIASDGSTGLAFKITQNGTDIFSSDPTVAAGTSPFTVNTFTALTTSPLPITLDDVFVLNITSGTSSWMFTAQLE